MSAVGLLTLITTLWWPGSAQERSRLPGSASSGWLSVKTIQSRLCSSCHVVLVSSSDYLGWIARAKLPATRQKRLATMLRELRARSGYMKLPYRVRE